MTTLLRATRDVFVIVARARAAAHLYDELSRQCDATLAEKGLRRADVTRAAYVALTIDHGFPIGGNCLHGSPPNASAMKLERRT